MNGQRYSFVSSSFILSVTAFIQDSSWNEWRLSEAASYIEKRSHLMCGIE